MLEPPIVDMLRSPDRLAALYRTGIMESHPDDEVFDRLLRLALRALDAPNGIIAFVDAERQYFKSRAGALGGPDPPRTLPLGYGFCPFTMATPRALVIPDARADPVWETNPVVRHKGVVAYLGVPLVDHEEHVLGTMCVLDHRPREWTEDQVTTLRDFAACVMDEVSLQAEAGQSRDLAELAERSAQRERWRSMQLYALAEASLIIHSASTLDESLTLIAQQAQGLIGAGRAAAIMCADGDWAHACASVTTYPGKASPSDYTAVLAQRAWMYRLALETRETICLTREEMDRHPSRPVEAASDTLPARSWLAAPLWAGDGVGLGVLEVEDRYTGEFTAEDQAVLLQLAQLASVAIDNVRLHDEQAELANAFQSSLLTRLPDVPGFDTAARYIPAQRARVSGDLYDVFPLADGSWGIVMGDVCGKGPEAAMMAAAARHAARAAALGATAPRDVLHQLNEALLSLDDSTPEFCTLVYAVLRPDGEGAELTLASGGHPLPYLVTTRATEVREVGAPGTLLGSVDDVEFVERSAWLGPGDAIVFFTDGLTDAVVGEQEFGPDGLVECLTANTDRAAAEIAEELAGVLRGTGVRQRDDVAILVLRHGT